MRIECRKPEEEWAIERALLEQGNPACRAAVVSRQHPAGPGIGLKAGFARIIDQIEAVLDGASEMPFAGGSRPVTDGLKLFNKGHLLRRQRPVQLLCVCVMRITSGDNARTARTARGDGHEGIRKSHSFPCEAVDVWGTNLRIAIGSCIIRGQIVGNDQDDIRTNAPWLFLRGPTARRQQQNQARCQENS